MALEPSSELSNGNSQLSADNGSGKLFKSDTKDPASIGAYTERMKTRHKLFDQFCMEFVIDDSYGTIKTTLTNKNGTLDTIKIHEYPESPKIESVNLKSKDPVHFAPTSNTLIFYRITPIKEPDPTPDPDEITFDYSLIGGDPTVEELDAEASKDDGDSEKKIQDDLRTKFKELSMPDIPLIPYARRLLKRTGYVQVRAAHDKAELLMPLYRSLEIKRLLTDPTDANVDQLSIVTQRQNVYNQLMDLYHEEGLSPEEIARRTIEGVFDSHTIAGVPVFSVDRDYYVVIDCAFSGYDENQPIGTDFEGKVVDRSYSEVSKILDQAEKHGYDTYFDTSDVDGGAHKDWQWHGIKIDGYDKDHPEENLPKVIKILKDVGIDPIEAASTVDPGDLTDLYMR